AARKAAFVVGAEYEDVTQQLACHRAKGLPKNINDINGLSIAAPRGTPAAEALVVAAEGAEDVVLHLEKQSAEELLIRVAAGDYDCAVVDSLTLKVINPYHPELAEAFDISDEMPLGWFLAPGSEDLKDRFRAWFAGTKKSGALAALKRRFCGFLPLFDYVDIRAFKRAINDRLPAYEKV
ncbi:MAG TPA: hypothetical protein DHK64_10165, partial [Rhodobiaceae bacterium]|nr:hypothetical protein [Rhodobiaceae bacterium]